MPILPRLGGAGDVQGITCTVLIQNDQLKRRYRNSGTPQRRGETPKEPQNCAKDFLWKPDKFRENNEG